MGDLVEPRRNLLVGLSEKLDKLSSDPLVSSVEESGGHSSVTGTTGSTDSVDVVIDILGEIAVRKERKTPNINDMRKTK